MVNTYWTYILGQRVVLPVRPESRRDMKWTLVLLLVMVVGTTFLAVSEAVPTASGSIEDGSVLSVASCKKCGKKGGGKGKHYG